jgi:hypothetical protein
MSAVSEQAGNYTFSVEIGMKNKNYRQEKLLSKRILLAAK